MGEKFYSANDVVKDSFKLSSEIFLQKAFIPNVIYKLVRGGDLAGNAAAEVLKYYGIKNLLASVSLYHYKADNTASKEDLVEISDYTLPPWKLRKYSSILIIDDLPDSWFTTKAVIEDIKDLNHNINPELIRAAFLVYKDNSNKKIPTSIKYRRLYNDGMLVKMHDKLLDFFGYKGKIIEKHSSIKKPDYFQNYVKVIDSNDPKSWVDFGTHELVGFTPEQIIKRYGKDVFDSLTTPDLQKITLIYGEEFADKMHKNLSNRLLMRNDKIETLKVPMNNNLGTNIEDLMLQS